MEAAREYDKWLVETQHRGRRLGINGLRVGQESVDDESRFHCFEESYRTEEKWSLAVINEYLRSLTFEGIRSRYVCMMAQYKKKVYRCFPACKVPLPRMYTRHDTCFSKIFPLARARNKSRISHSAALLVRRCWSPRMLRNLSVCLAFPEALRTVASTSACLLLPRST